MCDRVTASHTTAMHSYNNAYCRAPDASCLSSRRHQLYGQPAGQHPLAGPGRHLSQAPRRDPGERARWPRAATSPSATTTSSIPGIRWATATCATRCLWVCIPAICWAMTRLSTPTALLPPTPRTLHLGDDYGIGEGKDANFVILDAKDWYDALNYDAPILRNYRKGKLLASTAPVETQVFF